MKHEFRFDEDNSIMVLRIKGDFDLTDAKELLKVMEDIAKEKGACSVLTDMTQAPSNLPREIRQLMREQTEKMQLNRLALIVTDPAVRMIGKIVISTMGKAKDTAFFKTEEEALVWLKGDV